MRNYLAHKIVNLTAFIAVIFIWTSVCIGKNASTDSYLKQSSLTFYDDSILVQTNDTIPGLIGDSTLVQLNDTLSILLGDSTNLHQDTTSVLLPDSTVVTPNDSLNVLASDSLSLSATDSISGAANERNKDIYSKIQDRTILDVLSIPYEQSVASWRFNEVFLDYEISNVDTSLFLNHHFYPQQKNFESFTYPGNIGSPTKPDHFFSLQSNSTFLFSKNYSQYADKVTELRQYNVKSPFTKLFYTSAGKRSQMEQLFSVLHTQNAGKHLNFGVAYDNFGTKGVYQNQATRSNLISLFGNYNKANLFGQFSFVNRVFHNAENGGSTFDTYVPLDSLETRIVPVRLENAKSVTSERSISVMAGYTLLNIKRVSKDSLKQETYFPLINTKVLITREQHSRTFSDAITDENYFENFYISNKETNDTVSLVSWDAKAILEIAQFAKIPAMPGVRGWVGYNHSNYFLFNPADYLSSKQSAPLYSAHFGVGVFSESPFLTYRGAAKVYFSGDRAEDKEVIGDIRMSLWKDRDMPQLKGNIEISERTADPLYRNFFSNNYSWNNNFGKEKRFLLGFAFAIPRWFSEVGYNIAHIRDYLYFDTKSLPQQANDITVTSAYGQVRLKFGKGFNLFGKAVWQINSHSEVLSLPKLQGFGSFFYQGVIVKDALVGQFGVSATYRSSFFVNAFNPVIGQFYNQNIVEYPGYPVVEVFANFKWKRAILFVKYSHLNQGYPHNQYFSAYSYPLNPQVLKFGVSWIFYD